MGELSIEVTMKNALRIERGLKCRSRWKRRWQVPSTLAHRAKQESTVRKQRCPNDLEPFENGCVTTGGALALKNFMTVFLTCSIPLLGSLLTPASPAGSGRPAPSVALAPVRRARWKWKTGLRTVLFGISALTRFFLLAT